MLIVGEVMHVWRQGVYGNSLYFSHNSAMNLELLLKVKFTN